MVGGPFTPRAIVAVAALPLLLLLSAPQCSTAFVLRASTMSRERRSTTAASTLALQRPTVTQLLSPSASRITESREYGARLMMAAEPAEEGVAEEAAAAAAADEPVAEGEEEEAPATEGEAGETEVVEDGETEVVAEDEAKEEEEEEEVDPMEEVKQQIKDLEKDLIVAENKLRDAQDSIQEKGQMGFLRMAAQVDNFRKSSGAGTGDYEADAKAAVLTAMLPAFEPFEAAKEALKLETENEVKFNNSYQALYRQLKDVYSKIGATDFFGVVGEKFVYSRHEKASEEHSPVMKEGLILKCLSPGLELKKNVIRKAVCVVSLGPEKTEEAEKEEQAEDKEGGEEELPTAEAVAAEEDGGAGGEEGAGADTDAASPEGEEAAA